MNSMMVAGSDCGRGGGSGGGSGGGLAASTSGWGGSGTGLGSYVAGGIGATEGRALPLSPGGCVGSDGMTISNDSSQRGQRHFLPSYSGGIVNRLLQRAQCTRR